MLVVVVGWMKLSSNCVVKCSQPTGHLVLLHGYLGQARNWRSVQNALAQRSSLAVHAVDLRNHGSTTPHVPSMTIDEMSEDVTLFLRDLSSNSSSTSSSSLPIHLLGHSMGGKIAMHVALLHPSLLSSLIVSDVAPVSYSTLNSPHTHLLNSMSSLPLPLPHSVSQLDSLLLSSIPDSRLRSFAITNADMDNGRWKIPIPTLLQAWPHVRDTPSYHQNQQYNGKTLFIVGGDSDYVKKSDHQIIHKLFPLAQFVSIPGAGHWVHADKPNEFIAETLKFLNST